jgi:prepilin-type N-terminal cleavage/methylation domain-containing protein
MKQKPYQRALRDAFTLIELLVVMAIIAILISLLTAAVVRALIKAEEVRARNDLSQLTESVTNYQSKLSVDYFPSRIRLLDSGAYDLSLNANSQPNNQLDYDSYTYLKRVWPRIQFPIDWNNNGVADDAILEGDQCLVFFLGGPGVYINPSVPGSVANPQGFSNNGANPAQLGGSRLGPFYEFKSDRLIDPGRPASLGWPVYIDNYGGNMPYVYFSSYKARNGYARYYSLYGSDCSLVPQGAYNDGNNFYNPDTFQIICAGRNKLFGPGGLYVSGLINAAGSDDMANFAEGLLGN